MGRNFKGRSGGGRGGGGGGRGGKGNKGASSWDQNQKRGWADTVQENEDFEAYYLDQNIIPASEWAAFMQAFRDPLPTTFRITDGLPFTSTLTKNMQELYLPMLSSLSFEGEAIPPPKRLDWYPKGLAWQVDVRKNILRKQEQFKEFQQFLVGETEVGAISRQEAVSMIPPLFMDIEQHHIVLDLCAAPGSKTAQLIEALHVVTDEDGESRYVPLPAGLVIANDMDMKRAHMLVHQATRLPSASLAVTNLDASQFPRPDVSWMAASEAGKPEPNIHSKALEFDRILADVPCSGDGTFRKNLPIWDTWKSSDAVSLHSTQLRILMRGLTLLRPGGRLVYSTCSLNPVENEAVVAAALRKWGAGGADGKKGLVQLVDCGNVAPSLIRSPGMYTWKVDALKRPFSVRIAEHAAKVAQEDRERWEDEMASTQGGAEASSGAAAPVPGTAAYRATKPSVPWVSSMEELKRIAPELVNKLPATLWPEGDEVSLHLDRCMRVYPHTQNTGGFFIAVLIKGDDGKKDDFGEDGGMAPGMARAADSLAAREAEAALQKVLEGDSAAPELAPAEGEPLVVAPTVGDKRAASPGRDEEGEVLHAAKKLRADGEAEGQAGPSTKKGKAAGSTDTGHGLPGGHPYKEDPFVYVRPGDSQVESCRRFFRLAPTFPTHNLLVRNPEGLPMRNIYLTSSSLRALVRSGSSGFVADRDGKPTFHPFLNGVRLRMLSCGIKIFSRQNAGAVKELESLGSCRWRLSSDGLVNMRPYLDEERVLHADLSEFCLLLGSSYPLLSHMPSTPFGQTVRDLECGSYALDVAPGEMDVSWKDPAMSKEDQAAVTLHAKLSHPLHVSLWRSPNSVGLMMDKKEKTVVSLRIFGQDISPPITNKKSQGAGGNSGPAALLTEQQLEEEENVAIAAAAAAAAAAASAAEEQGKGAIEVAEVADVGQVGDQANK